MKRSTISDNRLSHIFRALATAAFYGLLWQVCYLIVGKDLLLASPLSTSKRVLELLFTTSFWEIMLTSLYRICAGFLLGVIAGTLLAVLSCRSAMLEALLRPLMSLMRTTPIASFIILAFIWIQSGIIPVFITFLIVTPAVWANVREGIRQTDPRLLEMAESYRVPRFRRLTWIYIPSVAPYFMAAFRTGLGMGWKAGIAAEVICMPRYGIGTQLYNSKVYLETVDLFAWTAVIIIMSFLLERLLLAIVRRTANRFQRWGGDT